MKNKECTGRILSGLSTLVLAIVMTVASAGGQVTAYLTDLSVPIQLYVAVTSINQTTAKITSVQTGCLDGLAQCPANRKAKINCHLTAVPGDVCSLWFPTGTKITLKASPGDFVFAGWDYESLSPGNNYNFGLDKTITVRPMGGATIRGYFVPKGTKYTLSVAPEAVLGGSNVSAARIESNPPGISCNGDGTGTCSYAFPAGSYVTLTAEHGTGTELVGWDLRVPSFPPFYDLCNLPGPCKVPMSYKLWN